MFTGSGISFAGKSVLLSAVLLAPIFIARVEAASTATKNSTQTTTASHAPQTKQTTLQRSKNQRKTREKQALSGINLLAPAGQRTFSNKQSIKALPLGSFTLRAYTRHARPNKSTKKTATGSVPASGRTVAVDPRVIPFGTKIYIEGLGERIAEDSGASVKGRRLDIFLSTSEHCRNFGVQTRDVKIMLE
ncbi:MAG: 3D domain-containing protein [Candidatus Binatia bacterium]